MARKLRRSRHKEPVQHLMGQVMVFGIITVAIVGVFQATVSSGGLALVTEAQIPETSDLLSSISLSQPRTNHNPSDYLVEITEEETEDEVIEEGNSEQEPVYYIVQSGDTISSIALKLGITVNDIIKINDIKSLDTLFPGQKIVVGYSS